MSLRKYYIFFLLIFLVNKVLSIENLYDYLENEDIINLTDNFFQIIPISGTKQFYNSEESYFSVKKQANSDQNLKVTLTIQKLGGEKINSTLIEFNETILPKNSHINITTNNQISLEISNVKKDENNEYSKIENEDESITLNSRSFIYFIKDYEKSEIQLDVTFTDSAPELKFYYILQYIDSKNLYLPTADLFVIEKYKDKDIKKVNETEGKDISETIPIPDTMDKKSGKLALLFSFERAPSQNYEVIINNDVMNVFLLISIGVGLVFAIITFFLIRRKQNPSSNIETGKDEDNKAEKEEEDVA
jgi:hypothetical protein